MRNTKWWPKVMAPPATLLCRRRHCARCARCDTGAILGTGDKGARVAHFVSWISYVAWDPNPDLLCLASSATKVTKYKIPAWATWPKTSTSLRLARTRNSSYVGCFKFRYKYRLTVRSIGVIHAKQSKLWSCAIVPQALLDNITIVFGLVCTVSDVVYAAQFILSCLSQQSSDTVVILYWRFCLYIYIY